MANEIAIDLSQDIPNALTAIGDAERAKLIPKNDFDPLCKKFIQRHFIQSDIFRWVIDAHGMKIGDHDVYYKSIGKGSMICEKIH